MPSISELESQIGSLNTTAAGYKNRLVASPTALGGDAAPSSYDVQNQTELTNIQNNIQRLTDQKLRAQWYPPQDPSQTAAESSGAKSGLVGSAVDFISRPLYGAVGALKHFTGQGQGSLGQDMADNILRNKSTVGDVLHTAGLPSGVSMPLGFALDVALDPINWLTMGTGALLPRLAVGAFKGAAKEGAAGALRGLRLAGESGVLSKATTTARFTPFLRRTETFGKLATAARTSTKEFENFTGETVGKMVQQRGMGIGSYRIGLGQIVNSIADASPGGQKFLENWIYDPAGWVNKAHIKDTLEKSLSSKMDVSGVVSAGLKNEDTTPFIKALEPQLREKLSPIPVHTGSVSLAEDLTSIDLNSSYNGVSQKEVDLAMSKLAADGINTSKIQAAAPGIVSGVDDAVSLLKNPELGFTGDPIENILRIAKEANSGVDLTLDEVAKIMKSHSFGQTGVEWFDNFQKNIRDTKYLKVKFGEEIYNVGKSTMDWYDKSMGIFRGAKIGASPTGHVNAWFGNSIMSHLTLGLDWLLLKKTRQAWNVLHDRPGAALLMDNLLSEETKLGLKEYNTAARGTMGSIDFIGARESANTKIFLMGKDAGLIPEGVTAADFANDMAPVMESLLDIKKSAEAKFRTGSKGGLEPARKLFKEGGISSPMDVGTGLGANELLESSVTREMFDALAKNAKDGSYAWKVGDFVFNKLSHEYETIDQSWKFGAVAFATTDGLTRNQLQRIRHYIDIFPEDLTEVVGKDGQWRYKLPANKALELSNVIYMNYNAMPAAIRVLRNMPLIGSPFASFMYGMSLKTAQAMAYNPSAFTKVNFAMNEFGGQKTPLEKKALTGNFYSYLNAPGMMRVPFFDKNPIYLNLTNMIPYYSLNMFNPSEANFSSSALPDKLVSLVQSSPLFKTPYGSVVFDYLIQPTILGEATAPQGQFGQPLYPVDANAGAKSLYALRSLGEAFVPNVAAYAGLVTPESLAQYVPSYRWRQLAEAKEGKNQLGISSKEPALSRTLRGSLSASGIPVQAPVDLTYQQKSN